MMNALRASTLFMLATGICAAQRFHGTRPYDPNRPAEAPAGSTITYNNGPVMLGTVHVYVIYYGNFTSSSRTVINTFLSHIGGTPLYDVNATYFNGSFVHLANAVHYGPANFYNDGYSVGKNITDTQTQQIVANAISGGHLPIDDNGVYFVLTAADVKQSASFGAFCVQYCGYHGPSTTIVSGHTIKYSFVGNAATQCPSGCIGNVAIYGDTNSPNNNLGADGMVSVMFHELSESVTDPELTAWWDSKVTGEENGDMCNFVYGTTFLAPNGTHANQTIGGKNFLLQEMFKLTQMVLPTDKGVCVQHNP